MWQLQHFQLSNDGGDLAILSLGLVSELPEGRQFTSLPLTTRRPLPGEPLTIIGFRFDPDTFPYAGNMLTAVGEVGQVYWPVRDSVMAPFPAIEIRCGSHGGMSGGAVLDQDGAVVGVISTGLGLDDGEGPTLAAWCVGVFGWHVTASWPRGFYPAGTLIANIPVIRILGRERLMIKDDGTVQLTLSGD